MLKLQNNMIKYLLLILHLRTMTCMPLQLQYPLLQPMPGSMQQQQLALQEQMLAVQQFQALQNLNLIPTVNTMNTSPILLIVPPQPNQETQSKENNLKNRNPGIEDTEKDSITINAEDENADDISSKKGPMKAFLLVPNARFSIGGFISQIPFLPIEINVPDSISWIYNGISSWVSGWGSSQNMQNSDAKLNWKVNRMPVLVMPFGPNMMI